jgi:hypothetical protein
MSAAGTFRDDMVEAARIEPASLQVLNRGEDHVQFLLDPGQTTGVLIHLIAVQEPGDRPAQQPGQFAHLAVRNCHAPFVVLQRALREGPQSR